LRLVVDASVTLAWCFSDEQTPEILAVLDRVTDEGAAAPQLWPLEVLNGLAVAERRGRLDAGSRNRAIEFLRALPISVDDETATRSWTSTLQLSETHGLTIYDASYLELALRMGAQLATVDRRLAAAARVEGLEA
jgi:predicted nucleic acid-binding protein